MRRTALVRVRPPGHRFDFAAGAVLLEALVGILVFALGVLGIAGLHARAVGYLTDAQTRGQAASLANAYVARMWTERPADIGTRYALDGQPAFDAFKLEILALPGAATIPNNPRVEIVPAAPGEPIGADVVCPAARMPPDCNVSLAAGATIVTVTIRWMPPGLDLGSPDIVAGGDRAPHAYSVTAILGFNV